MSEYAYDVWGRDVPHERIELEQVLEGLCRVARSMREQVTDEIDWRCCRRGWLRHTRLPLAFHPMTREVYQRDANGWHFLGLRDHLRGAYRLGLRRSW